MDAPIARRGVLLVLSSPSGAGKTTLARRLGAADPAVTWSISATTRPPRPGETDGRDYFFIDEAEFVRRRDAGEFLEWARVFGNFYGTPKAPVLAALAAGRDVLFDIDWQGTQQLTAQMPQDVVRVFVLPPTGDALRERLETRRQDPPKVVAERMASAAVEISHWPEYDYVIVNAALETSLQNLQAILAAERLKRIRQIGLQDFVRNILASSPVLTGGLAPRIKSEAKPLLP
ncbi:MAG: guanylate kinase [Hyphomicrobiaceae bacterium]